MLYSATFLKVEEISFTSMLLRQIFSLVVETKDGAKSRGNIGPTSVKWKQTRLGMIANVALCLQYTVPLL